MVTVGGYGGVACCLFVVTDLHTYPQPDEEVLRLDVPVDDVLGVAVGQRLRELQDVLYWGG